VHLRIYDLDDLRGALLPDAQGRSPRGDLTALSACWRHERQSYMNQSKLKPSSRRNLVLGAGAAAAVAGVGVALWRFEPQAVARSRQPPVLGSAI
jgi:hypothetical protein